MKKIALFLFLSPLFADSQSEQIFTQIYEKKSWGVNEEGKGYSGHGANVRSAAPYMKFLQDFIKKHKIRSIVDVGCGDWTFSQYIDWNGAKYTGFDIVKNLIEKNKEQFANAKINFVHGDAIKLDLGGADLLICKDVLQHLPHADIQEFLKKTSKFKHCLLTNDIIPNDPNNWDIPTGEWRLNLDLSKPPFNVKGKNVLRYSDSNSTKQVFYIEN